MPTGVAKADTETIADRNRSLFTVRRPPGRQSLHQKKRSFFLETYQPETINPNGGAPSTDGRTEQKRLHSVSFPNTLVYRDSPRAVNQSIGMRRYRSRYEYPNADGAPHAALLSAQLDFPIARQGRARFGARR